MKLVGSVFIVLLAGANLAHAVSGTWIQTTSGGTWSDGGNWSNAAIADGPDSTAAFNMVNITADDMIHLDSARAIGNLIFGDTDTATAANWVLDNNGNVANILTLGVSAGSPIITVNGLGVGSSATISANISGTSGFTKAGVGALTLSATNTYSGGTTISSGTLTVSSGATLGSGGLTFTNPGGTAAGVVLNSSQSVTSLSATNSSTLTGLSLSGTGTVLTINQGSANTTFGGVLSGNGSITKFGSGTLTLSQTNSVTGTISVLGGGLTLDMSGTNFTATNQLILPAGATLAVGGANILTKINSLNAVIQSLKLIVGAGSTSFTQSRASGGSVINTFSTVTRAVGGTMDVSPIISGSNSYRINNAAGINGVVPWAVVSGSNWFAPSSIGDGTGNDGTAYSAYTNSTATSLGTSSQNSNINTNVTIPVGGATINTIRFNQSSLRSVTISGTDTLTVAAGGILVTNAVRDNRLTITGGILTGGSPGSGSGSDLIVIQNNNPANGPTAEFIIGSIIADGSGGAMALTKSGSGMLKLTNTASTYTGKTFLNAGTTRIAGDRSLGAVPSLPVADSITFTSGTLQLLGSFDFDLSANRGMTLNASGGTFDTRTSNSTYSGVITGDGAFTKAGDGALTLTQPNTYTGGTILSAGVFKANNGTGSATGTGIVTVIAEAILGGTGTVTGLVSLASGGSAGSGGHIAPGNGVGSLTVGSVAFANNSVLDFDFNNTLSSDLLNVADSGGLTINGGGFNLYAAGTPNKWVTTGTYNLIQYTGSIGGSGVGAWTASSILNPQAGLTYNFGTSGGYVTLAIGGSATGRIINTISLTDKHAPGENAGVSFKTFNNHEIGIGGQVVFGGFLPSSSLQGIWANLNGTTVSVAKAGQQAPGLPAGVNFAGLGLQSANGPHIDENNEIVFKGTLNTGAGGVTPANQYGIWFGVPGSLTPLYRSGTQAPDTQSGAVFSDFSSLGMNRSGKLAFTGYLEVGTAGVTSANDVGLWSNSPAGTLHLIAREGSAAPGVNDGRFFEATFGAPEISDHGLVLFAGRLNDDARGLWIASGSGVSLVALGGQQAPGTPAGALFNLRVGSTQTYPVSPWGNVAFASALKEGSGGVTSANLHGLWALIGGTVSLVAREGSQAPGLASGIVYSSGGASPFDGSDVNDSGTFVFKAFFAGPGVTGDNDSGIWSGKLSDFALIAREGSLAPGTGSNFVFSDLATTRPRLNELGQFAFLADAHSLDGTQTTSGLWAYNPGDGLFLVAKDGDQLEVAPGDLRTIESVGAIVDSAFAIDRALNDSGQLLFAATFTDGSQGLFTASVPEPSAGALLAAGIGLFLVCRRQVWVTKSSAL